MPSNNPDNKTCPTDVKLTGMSRAQFESCMNWDDWRIMAMFQIFAAGVGKTAGLAPSSQALPAGMDAVYQWWCANGMPLGNEPDVSDVAAQLAVEIASLIYEPDDIQDALSTLTPKWKSTPCASSLPVRMLGASRRAAPRRSAHRGADKNPKRLALSGPNQVPASPPEAPELKACVEQYVQDYGMTPPQAYRQCSQDLMPPDLPPPLPKAEPEDAMQIFFRDMESRKPKQGLAERLLRDFK